jgi:hypothetical protein
LGTDFNFEGGIMGRQVLAAGRPVDDQALVKFFHGVDQ